MLFVEERERGKAAYREKRYKDAVVHFSAALDVAGVAEEEELHLLHSNRCAALQQLGQWREALDDAEAVTALKPQFAKGWSRLSSCLGKLGRRLEAEAAASKATELDPRNFPTRKTGGPAMPDMRQVRAWLENPTVRQYLFYGAAAFALWLVFGGRSKGAPRQAFNSQRGYPSSSYNGGGLGMMGLGAIMLAAWKLPPLYGHPPFFGMSPMTLLWLLQSFTGGGGGCMPRGGFGRGLGGGLFGGGPRRGRGRYF